VGEGLDEVQGRAALHGHRPACRAVRRNGTYGEEWTDPFFLDYTTTLTVPIAGGQPVTFTLHGHQA
jgi:hypothetical protein